MVRASITLVLVDGHTSCDGGSHFIEASGGVPESTCNRMEIQAVIEGLLALKEPCEVLLISDSQYLLRGVGTWRYRWRADGWVRIRHKRTKTVFLPLKNDDLWRELDRLAEQHTLTCQWVRGHNGDPDNERCDFLAQQQSWFIRV
jgi:ribonuclease HI